MSTQRSLLLPTTTLNGERLFTVVDERERPGAYAGATISVKYTPRGDAQTVWGPSQESGPGIYGCFWKGALFYIGTYAGRDVDLRLGNVAGERWWKHVEGMTFRSRRIGIAPSRLEWITTRHTSRLAQLLGEGDRAKLTKKGGNGIQVQYNKFLFADQHWADFERLDQSMMSLFDFIYVRPDLEAAFPELRKEQVDPHLRAVEQATIRKLCPPCNGASKGAVVGAPDDIRGVTRTIETLMTDQIAGLLSGDPAYQLKPRKIRSSRPRVAT